LHVKCLSEFELVLFHAFLHKAQLLEHPAIAIGCFKSIVAALWGQHYGCGLAATGATFKCGLSLFRVKGPGSGWRLDGCFGGYFHKLHGASKANAGLLGHLSHFLVSIGHIIMWCHQEDFHLRVLLATEFGVLLLHVVHTELAVALEAASWTTHCDILARVAAVALLFLVASTVG
jgi:hypothetical protein